MKNLATLALAITLFAACEKKIDYNVADITAFEPLPKPEPGKGYQLHIPAFPVPADFEREIFVRYPIGNTEEIYVSGYKAKMRPGTHHLVAYKVDENAGLPLPKIGVIRDQNLANGTINLLSNINNSDFIVEATSPEYEIDLPAGYALPMKANQTLDLNSHYFNKTGKTLFGEVFLNIYTIPKSEVQHFLKEFSIDAEEINIPPNSTKEIVTIHTMEEKTNLIMVTSHYHKRGKKFDIYGVGGANDGKLLYTSTDYVHPVIDFHGTNPIVLQKGDKLKVVATYVNETNRTIQFGPTSEDEMCIAYMYITNN
jgi:hypothetical protein